MVLCMLAHEWACNCTGTGLVLMYQAMYCSCVVNDCNSIGYACIVRVLVYPLGLTVWQFSYLLFICICGY